MNGLIFVLLAISVSVKGQEWTVGTTIRYSGDATDIGESAFNALFRASPPFIIRRECPTCSDANQKVIYYRRITPDNTWDAYKNMRSHWFSANNILNTNFILANDLDAAIAGTNQFATCNYDDPGIGSFRDCGRNGLIGGQWTSVNRDGNSARFSIYTINHQDWTIGTTIRFPNDNTDLGEQAFNRLFRAGAAHPHYIIRRECPTCTDANQKVIYYKRITPDNTWNAYKNMRSDWFSVNNILNTNFILTNDLEAAIAGTNQFALCNYDDPGIGSFRDCGRNGLIGGQWTSVNRDGNSARFSIYTINHQDWTIGTTVRFPNDNTDLGEQAFNTLFRTHPHHIIRRECPSCQDAHQKVIYYKRITPDNTWNAYKNMRSDWFSENNILNTNFILANDLDAAIAGTNQFATCNYDDP
eukprot:76453_1